MTRVKLPAYDRAPALPRDVDVAYDEILRLASLARAIDPSLPAHVRFFQRAPDSAAEQRDTPGRVVFTTDTRPHLDGGLQDSRAVDLFDALEKVLPAHLTTALRARLDNATGHPSSAGIQAQAFRAAQAAGRVDLSAVPTNEPGMVIVSSPAVAPAALAFRDDPFLADAAAAFLERPRQQGEDPAFDFIANVNTVRQALATDAARLPASRVRQVVDALNALDTDPHEPAYEQRAQQGWLAYSVLAGGRNWAAPLLKQAPDKVGAYTPFRGVSPIVAGVMANDAATVGAVLDAGMSPHVYLGEVPRVLAMGQDRVESLLGDRFSLPALAVACGSDEALGQLARHGAMLDLAGAQGKTPLHVAAQMGNESATRVLLANGADPGVRDHAGRRPVDVATGPVQAVLSAPLVDRGAAGPAGPR